MKRIKPKLMILISALLIGWLPSISKAGDGIIDYSLKPNLHLKGTGLSYITCGKSVISESKLYQHSSFEIKGLPEGAVIIKAFLYWAGEIEASKSADTRVVLKTPDKKTADIDADQTWTALISGLAYVCRADITGSIQGNGEYEISYIDADPLEPAHIKGNYEKKAHYTLGGWALIVIFNDPRIESEGDIQIYDGMLFVSNVPKDKKDGIEIPNRESKDKKTADYTVISGFGRPWDGGSIVFDESRLSGKEDFAGNAGLAWDINRELVFLRPSDAKYAHNIKFNADYNAIMPIALVMKFGDANTIDILRVADSYIEQSKNIDTVDIYNAQDSSLEEREFLAKEYIKELLRAKAALLFERVKETDMPPDKRYSLHAQLGKLYLEQDNSNLAEAEFKEMLIIKHDDYRPYFNLSQICYSNGDLDNAINYLEKAKALNTNNAAIYLNLGMCLAQKNLFTEALKEYEIALRLENDASKKADILKRIEIAREAGKK